MNTVIILFILIANIVAILLTYYSFSKDFEKSKKLFYTMISMGVIYIITLIVYLLSTIGIAKEVAKSSKNMITNTNKIFLQKTKQKNNNGKAK